MKGPLMKRSSSNKWQKRDFQLNSDGTLSYAQSTSSTKTIATFSSNGSDGAAEVLYGVGLTPVSGAATRYIFQVREGAKGRLYTLCANTESELRGWVGAIAERTGSPLDGLMTGYYGCLTSEQETALKALQEKIATQNATDGAAAEAEQPPATSEGSGTEPWKLPLETKASAKDMLGVRKSYTVQDILRFLRARDFDVDKSWSMLEASVSFNARVKPETLSPELNFPNMASQKFARFCGVSKCGYPILHIELALWRPSELYSVDECIRCLAWVFERLLQTLGPNMERFVMLFDEAGFGYEHAKPFSMKCIHQFIMMLQDQYPERLAAAFLINAPYVFQVAWKVMRPWIDPVTATKIHFTSGDAQKELLLHYIDADVLEQDFGGKHERYPPCDEAPEPSRVPYDPSQPDPFKDLGKPNAAGEKEEADEVIPDYDDDL